jgi:hypothetical protein
MPALQSRQLRSGLSRFGGPLEQLTFDVDAPPPGHVRITIAGAGAGM